MRKCLPLLLVFLLSASATLSAQTAYDKAIERGERHEDKREYDKAIDAYTEALKLIPDSPRAYVRREDLSDFFAFSRQALTCPVPECIVKVEVFCFQTTSQSAQAFGRASIVLVTSTIGSRGVGGHR